MRLLVTGCGRSGTMWTAEALRSTGIDCQHEGAFTSNYKNSAQNARARNWTAEVSHGGAPWTPLPDTYVVHLVRDPLKVIASTAGRKSVENQAAWIARRELRHSSYVGRWIEGYDKLDDPLELAVTYYDGWNDLVVADELIRFEDIDADTIQRLARIIYPHASLPELPGQRNASEQPPKPVTWKDVLRYSRGEGVAEKARHWGYL